VKPNYEIRVGLFALFALILLVWGWSWLKSFSFFHLPQRFIVRFHDVAGLNNNATVNINGVRVGTVEKVELIGKGQVLVHVKITAENVVVTRGSTVTIQTLGLVGAKYVEITLPDVQAGAGAAAALQTDEEISGQDPVRVELIVNDIATRASKIFKSVKSEKAGTSLAEALEHSGEAVRNINEASAKLNKNMDKLAKAADSVTETSDKIGQVADRAKGVESSATGFFNQGSETLEGISDLAHDLQGTNKKIKQLFDNPALSKDLKETAQLAKQTAENVSKTIQELNQTLRDEPLRKDLVDMLTRLNQSTDNIYRSVQIINKVASDEGLRSDVKEVVANAKQAVAKADELIGQPDFKANIRQTISKVNTAAGHVDLAARQLNQVLDRRAPLFHLMFGRPGHIPPEQAKNDADRTTSKID